MSAASHGPTTVVRDVRIFDADTGGLTGPSDVTVRGRTIATIRPAGHPAPDVPGATVVEGAGRTLIPGLVDAHWHAAFAAIDLADAFSADPGYVQLLAGRAARDTLLRGFTTVRDVGGPVFGLKRAIDEGVVEGPRIYPSGAFISQSGGHGDFRARPEVTLGTAPSLAERLGATVVADGADAVLRAAREQLMLGASQLKLLAGGGAASAYDPVDVTEFTERELHAAVEAAENWGTYVTVHAYTPRAVAQALRAGVRCVEHGQLLDEPGVEALVAHGAWWCLQGFLDDEDLPPMRGENRAKQMAIVAGTDRAFTLARRYGAKIAWGTDTLFDGGLAARQGHQLAKLTRWFTPAEVLTLATARNAELLALSGPRNPYPGRLGVVAEGALADLVLVDGDPLQDITLLARPEEAFPVIVKDGRVVKNALVGAGVPVGAA